MILVVDEVWHWDQWSADLFLGYMNAFFKTKEEASGYPELCHTEADKDRDIRQVFETDGVYLDKEKIEKNPGL